MRPSAISPTRYAPAHASLSTYSTGRARMPCRRRAARAPSSRRPPPVQSETRGSGATSHPPILRPVQQSPKGTNHQLVAVQIPGVD